MLSRAGPAIYTRLFRHAMCAAHTFGVEGFPIRMKVVNPVVVFNKE